MDHLYYICLVFFMLLRLFIVVLWPPAEKGMTSWLLFVMYSCVFVTFLSGILGQVWYLIEAIPDLCHLSYLGKAQSDPEIIKLFSCATQLSTKFQLLMKAKIPTN